MSRFVGPEHVEEATGQWRGRRLTGDDVLLLRIGWDRKHYKPGAARLDGVSPVGRGRSSPPSAP